MESLVLALVLSADAFAAGIAFGAEKIKVSISSALVISVICSGVLALSLAGGSLLAPYMPQDICRQTSAAILMILGAVKLFDSTLKRLIQRRGAKRLRFRLLSLSFIFEVYADPPQADADRSSHLSPKESVSLAAAMSLDGLTIGFGAGLGTPALWPLFLLSLFITLAAVLVGGALGRLLAARKKADLSWLSGLILIALGLFKLI